MPTKRNYSRKQFIDYEALKQERHLHNLGTNFLKIHGYLANGDLPKVKPSKKGKRAPTSAKLAEPVKTK